ncbi:thiazole biosynthesis adenylyltransferase ThiF [Cytobacillus spongiae]|uniref:thiazole biosynthesis adenylyltransferase ThiF n=1 Tax=Cytobacillus spongiae TaxID=2901381 RepID=UPI001F439588|nr:thiazole biosynthesis adenylyltransferase ThiF [Cytobacillus spongiae]UII56426.1 thiazole biosynthesis adenylyltransferase ThiF [Cytobacillus spongiae]
MEDRYSRQQLFSKIGEAGQRKLANKHVLLIGAGALGTGNAEMLVRAGVGKLTIADRDYVEWSNLQRQQLYVERDAKHRIPKAVAAERRLAEINGDVEVIAHVSDVSVEEIEQLVEGVDLIIDATDNFDIRLLINDASQKWGIPWIYGACVGSYGISYTIIPGKTPCLNCLLEEVPLGGMTCDTAGIIGPAVGMVVAHQTTEALKILTEAEGDLRGTLVSFDLWENQFSNLNVAKIHNSDCPSCGNSRFYPFLDKENHMKTAVLCGRNTVQIRPAVQVERDLQQLEQMLLAQGGKTERNPFLLSFTKDEHRVVVFRDGRVLVHGTKDISEAKSLYHKLFA